METKRCSKCKVVKPLSEFYKNRKNNSGVHCWCKDCKMDYQKEYSKRPEVKARAKEYELLPKVKARRAKYSLRPDVKERRKKYSKENRRVYGIMPKQKQQMILDQDGKCDICGNELDMGKYTHIDHDHKTGIVRGVLCRNCNLLLGYGKDNPDIIRAAANYLDKHRKGSE